MISNAKDVKSSFLKEREIQIQKEVNSHLLFIEQDFKQYGRAWISGPADILKEVAALYREKGFYCYTSNYGWTLNIKPEPEGIFEKIHCFLTR